MWSYYAGQRRQSLDAISGYRQGLGREEALLFPWLTTFSFTREKETYFVDRRKKRKATLTWQDWWAKVGFLLKRSAVFISLFWCLNRHLIVSNYCQRIHSVEGWVKELILLQSWLTFLFVCLFTLWVYSCKNTFLLILPSTRQVNWDF